MLQATGVQMHVCLDPHQLPLLGPPFATLAQELPHITSAVVSVAHELSPGKTSVPGEGVLQPRELDRAGQR